MEQALFPGQDNPAAYFGILLTGFNLLPAGQLDGGHIAYAVLAILTMAAMIFLGIFFWWGWFIWAGLIFFMGLRQAAPLNDVTPLDPARRLIGLGAILIFAVTFVPAPF